MESVVRVSEVFVPGRLPDYTYNPRSELHLETKLRDYVDEAGAILTVSGPTKTGKSVLLRRVIKQPAWVDGQGIKSVDEMWMRAGDPLGIYTGVDVGYSESSTGGGKINSEAGFAPFVKVGAEAAYSGTESTDRRLSVQRPIGAAVREHLERTRRSLVIDDFHFIERNIQREIVRALKPVVLAGVPVILVSISHRVQDVVTAEPDMTGRVSSLPVKFWAEDELLVIAQKGFQALNISDPDDRVAARLAKESYGSPHLMQKFCREVCKQANLRETQADKVELPEPPNWDDFFREQVDGASADWFQRLLRGPQERGSARTQWTLGSGGTLDGYGVTLQAIASTGPELTLTKDEIKEAVDKVVTGSSPAAHQTTRVLQHMSKIAATRANTPVPSEEELDAMGEPDAVPDTQPVLEYVEDGPNSALHVADPFFAFYLRWGAPIRLDKARQD